MKFILLSSLIVTLLIFSSCKDEMSEIDQETEDPQAYLMSLTDSCSYTIDGKRYTCNTRLGAIRANTGVNLDSITDKGHPDSVLYYTSFTLGKPKGGHLVIRFAKKYGKDQLKETSSPFFRKLTNEIELYPMGEHPFAVDFERSNSREGVAIDVVTREDDSSEFMFSYIPVHRRFPTTLGLDCQSDSNFEILSLHTLPNGKHIIEARFTANVFNDWKEEKKRLENGYIRILVD